jgi:chromosome segregation ATPase
VTTIPHADDLGRARTAADFAAVIALLDTELNNAAARKQELEQAEDRAVFGDGDLGEVRAALTDCNAAVALLEKTIEAVRRRRAAAAQGEARADIVALGDEIKSKAASLGERWRTVHRLIEQLRQELFEADALNRAIATANGLFDAAGVADLKINLTTIRRAAMAGARAAAPARLGRPAIQADRLLLSYLSPGGALDPRPALGAPVEGAKSKFIPIATERG